MQISRPRLRIETLVGLVALYLVACGNVPWWRAVLAGRPIAAPGSWAFAACTFVALAAAHFLLLIVLSSRWTVRPVLTLAVVVTILAAYYMDRYGVLLDPTMLRNIVRTDPREAREFVTVAVFLHTLAWSALPLGLIWWVKLEQRTFWRALVVRGALALGAAVLALVALLPIARDFLSLMRNHRELRYLVTPGNLVASLVHNARIDLRAAQQPKIVVGADAVRNSTRKRPVLFVLALGETARAANFSLLGYARQTNPELATRGVTAFRNVTACGTSTEVSVPCMFSPYGRADFDEERIHNSESLLDVLRRAGFAVEWYDNQSGCKGVCTGNGIGFNKMGATFAPDLCDGADCLDDILVRALEKKLAEVTTDTVVVLHLLGNHGPAYHRRYPPAFRRFTPDCQTAELRDCTREEVVNAYDNAILYTDHVLAELIDRLAAAEERLDTALLYVSDHGESLGEAGLYLHGIPYAIAPRVQTHVPMVSWLSPGFTESSGLLPACLATRVDEPLSHDHLFHSVLGVLDVTSSAYRRERDLFAPCRKADTEVS
ncbi:MAG: phosphoethanolamine--lipid A transferase [Thermoanaerobaculia bacterium]|nr:phosphoethanolamine--lipid A transferase [Thermoanaerobaculia bacterium]